MSNLKIINQASQIFLKNDHPSKQIWGYSHIV